MPGAGSDGADVAVNDYVYDAGASALYSGFQSFGKLLGFLDTVSVGAH